MAQTGRMDRDRDPAGRPRNARPRDELGRPLPYGTEGVPRQPEGEVRTPEQTLYEAQRLFDSGRPFHAHEVFEDAWKAAREADDADLWKGLAQLAVGCTHRLRGNTEGADRLLRRADAALAPYASTSPYDIDVARLRAWAQQPQPEPCPGCARSTRTTHPASDPDSQCAAGSADRVEAPDMPRNSKEIAIMIPAGSDGRGRARRAAGSGKQCLSRARRGPLRRGQLDHGAGRDRGRCRDGRCR